MRITLITVGKIKEKFYQDAISEYAKRLSRYCKLDVIQVTDEKTPDEPARPWRPRSKKKKENGSWKILRTEASSSPWPSTGPCWIRWSWQERSKNGGSPA